MFQYMKRLRADLESLRTLAELTRKREMQKRQQAEIVKRILDLFLLAHEAPLRAAFEKIMKYVEFYSYKPRSNSLYAKFGSPGLFQESSIED